MSTKNLATVDTSTSFNSVIVNDEGKIRQVTSENFFNNVNNEINNAGRSQLEAINNTGSAQLEEINTAGSTQLEAIEKKGVETLESIPEDYTALQGDVTELKGDIERLPITTVVESLSDTEYEVYKPDNDTVLTKEGNKITGIVPQSGWFYLQQSPATFVTGRKYKIVLDVSHNYDVAKTFTGCSFHYASVNNWSVVENFSVQPNEFRHIEAEYVATANGCFGLYCYGGTANVSVECKIYDITNINKTVIDYIVFNTLGRVEYISSFLAKHALTADKIVETDRKISCIGDSLTYGYGAIHGQTDYPTILSQLNGKTVYNLGVSGEATDEILARHGGYPAKVNPFVIPADTSMVEITFADSINIGSNNTPLLRKDSGSLINPVIIDGVTGNISASDSRYYFSRLEVGESHSVKRPCSIYTKEMLEHKDDIQVIFMGTNGGWMVTSDTADMRIKKLTNQIDMMIDYNSSKKYIVVGLHSFYSWILYNGLTKDMLENEMKLKYGNNYINLRKYMIEYGLSDANLTPTQADTEAINNGNVPPSLLDSDGLHGNDKFYNILANLVNKKGKELGYW